MKILFILIGKEYGGVSSGVSTLISKLSKKYEIGVVSAKEDRFILDAMKYRCKVFINSWCDHGIKPIKDIFGMIRIGEAIIKFNPEIISLHGAKAGILGRLINYFIRKRNIIYNTHNWYFDENKNKLLNMVAIFIEKILLKRTRKVICVSRYEIDLAKKYKLYEPQKFHLVYNGVSNIEYGLKRKIDEKNEIKRKGNIIISVMRLKAPKDPFTLLKAAKLLVDVEFKLKIVGDGELKDRLINYLIKNKLEDKVELLGYRTDIPDLLSNSDVFVLSSWSEGLPRSIIEAMLSELPVVSSAVGGIPEIVLDGETGFLFPAGDAMTLARKIKILLFDKDLRDRLGKKGRERAIDIFNLDKYVSSYESIFNEVVLRKNEKIN